MAGTLGSDITIEEVPPARLRGNLGESDESKFWFRLMIPFTFEGEGAATLSL